MLLIDSDFDSNINEYKFTGPLDSFGTFNLALNT